MGRGGYVKLYRSLAEHPMWLQEPFTRGQFWAHLLMIANWRDTTVMRGNRATIVRRGQVFTSITKLGTTVSRNRKTIRAWLAAYASDGMLDIETGHGADGGFTLLTIRNFEKYQGTDPEAPDNDSGAAMDNGSGAAMAYAPDNALAYGPDTSKKKAKEKEEHTTRPLAAAVGSPPRVLLAQHGDLFERRHGVRPVVNTRRALAILADLVRSHGMDVVQSALRKYMAIADDEYVRKAGWSLNLFRSRFNSLIVAGTNGAAGINAAWAGQPSGDVNLREEE